MDGASALTVADLASARGITRLCHLTPFRNLVHLASDDAGLLSLHQLGEAQGDFDQQDLERLDNHPDHISCSIQYPNGWYLRQRRVKATPIQRLFPDWVCLAIDSSRLWAPGTRVCIRNAAAGRGSHVKDVSPESFEELYASPIVGARGAARRRSPARLRACPTDDQAEVLVHRSVPLSEIQAVIVASESEAKRFYAALRQICAKVEGLRWLIAPILFTTAELSNAIACGQRPSETPWDPYRE